MAATGQKKVLSGRNAPDVVIQNTTERIRAAPGPLFTIKPVTPDEPAQLARTIRQHLLDLHKLLLDAERAEYERALGAATSPTVLLQLLMADPRFAWLRHVSRLIVALDEALSIRRPAPPETLWKLLRQSRELLEGSAGGEAEFQGKYRVVLAASPEAARLHAELLSLLN